LIVKRSEEFVTGAEFANHVANEAALHTQNAVEHQNIFQRLGGQERGLRTELQTTVKDLRGEIVADIKAVEQKVNGLQSDLAAVGQQAETHRSELAEMRADIKTLLGRH
jgi:phage shock protein A